MNRAIVGRRAKRFKTPQAVFVDRDDFPVDDCAFRREPTHGFDRLRVIEHVAIARQHPNPLTSFIAMAL